jgi:hypothetical protein
MTTIATIVGIMSGFFLAGMHREPANIIATSLAIDASLAPLTALIARRRGRSATRWMVLGFVLGAWALAWILLFGQRRRTQIPHDFPPTSDAA